MICKKIEIKIYLGSIQSVRIKRALPPVFHSFQRTPPNKDGQTKEGNKR